MAPRAKGRSRVRATFLSRSRSKVSFHVQAAPRKRALPTRKKAFVERRTAGDTTGVAIEAASNVPKTHGRNRYVVPAGLSSRISSAYGTHGVGRRDSIPLVGSLYAGSPMSCAAGVDGSGSRRLATSIGIAIEDCVRVELGTVVKDGCFVCLGIERNEASGLACLQAQC